MYKLICIFLACSHFNSFSKANTYSDQFNNILGMTFNVPGPNCFATAMKLGGIIKHFRAMDEKEFSEIKRLFCQKVVEPQAGDIGVFEKPGFGFVHAYLLVSKNEAIQKPGVDYAGKTSISIQSIESIKYLYEASPECRRYSKDISLCSNQNYYIRCRPIEIHSNEKTEIINKLISNLELKIEITLTTSQFENINSEVYDQMKNDYLEIESGFAKNMTQLDSKYRKYLELKLLSLRKQLDFFSLKLFNKKDTKLNN